MDVIILCVGTGVGLIEETVNKLKPMEEIGGMPVLLIEQSRGLQYNPIPDKFEQDPWKECSHRLDILAGIEYYRKKDKEKLARHHQLDLQICETYFKPVFRQANFKIIGDSIFAES